jgi:hypothetical protein
MMVASWFASQACMPVGCSAGPLGQPVGPGWGQHMVLLVDRRVACLLVRARQKYGSALLIAGCSGGVGKIFLLTDERAAGPQAREE